MAFCLSSLPRTLVPSLGLSALLFIGCGGGSSNATPVPQPPATPILSAPAQVTAGKAATASVQSAQAALTYSWTLTGGSFQGGGTSATGSSVTFTASSAGSLGLSCTAREGSGPVSSAGVATVTVLAAPVITAFAATPSRIASGASTNLNFAFSGGTASINQGVGTVTSGQSASVSPTLTTTYTLTVANALNDTATATASVAVDVTSPVFLPTGSMGSGRYHQATRLPDGKVLITGGVPAGNSRAAERFDPATGAFTALAELIKVRTDHAATLLNDGRVLLTGGDETGYTSLTQSTTELYVPSSGNFVAGPLLGAIRFRHTATLLSSGKVLIVGGEYGPAVHPNGFDFHASAELFDPTTNLITAVGSMSTPRAAHTATLLSNGKVLITGGVNQSGNLASAELFDPSSNTFSAVGSMGLSRSGHSATLLNSGLVLVMGDVFGSPSAELYNPASGTFSATGSMSTGRVDHRAVLLANGKVLVAGGYYSTGYSYPAVAELYDPTSGTFSTTASMATGRTYFGLTRLASGRVLVSGGWNGGTLTACELFDPADALPGLAP